MSLATRCSHCGTVFRVVQDQLKVSEGWVRCGRCAEVFNAVEGLFDLDREAPPEWTPRGGGRESGAAPGPKAPTATYSYHAAPPPDAAPSGAGAPIEFDSPAAIPAPARAEPVGPSIDELEPAVGERIEPRMPDIPLGVGEPSDFDPRQPQRADRQPARSEPIRKPEFVRAAEERARWERSPQRALLALGVLLLAALLGAQWLHHFRDLVAARWPAAAPTLEAWCGQVGCRIGPPRRIESIAVESSGLVRAGAPDQFRLSITLRNRDTVAVAMPSVDLALTDSAGQLAARRALDPSDFGVAAALIAPGAEQSLQLLLEAPSLRVAGYTVEVFYP